MRLDIYLVQIGLYKSRNKALEGIRRGEVLLNGNVCDKPSTLVSEKDCVSLAATEKPFVSIGGDKLNRAIQKLDPPIQDRVFIDIGASTGGFTDCLLRRGAKKVYCVDVGENLLDPTISSDERVTVMDRTNARYLTPDDFEDPADGIVVDCSFISLEYILPSISNLLDENGFIMALIKPQFELKERKKLKNGILKDEKEREKILRRLYDFTNELQLIPKSIVSVTVDDKKNQEYIFLISKSGSPTCFEKIMFD